MAQNFRKSILKQLESTAVRAFTAVVQATVRTDYT